MANVIAVKVNSLLTYPLNDDRVEDWVLILHELYPEVDSNKLNEVANKFITGEYSWDNNLGIQNLTKVFEKEKRTSTIENNIW